MSEKKVVKITETKFPFGLRIGKADGVLVMDFMNERDEETLEVFSSLAVNRDMAKDIVKSLESAFPDLLVNKSVSKK